MESMEDFASMLDASFQDVRNGDIVEGTILEVQKDTVVVDIHSFMDGVLPGTELLYEPAQAEDLPWQQLLQYLQSALPHSDAQSLIDFAESHSRFVVMAYAG